MFCSRSKSEQPNSSDELVPQAPSTAYELIGRVGEKSVSCDCRHCHKFNTAALSVTLPIITQETAAQWRSSSPHSSHLFPSLNLLFLDFYTAGSSHGKRWSHPKCCGFGSLALMIPTSNLRQWCLMLITNMALSAFFPLLSFPARISHLKLAGLMGKWAEMQK